MKTKWIIGTSLVCGALFAQACGSTGEESDSSSGSGASDSGSGASDSGSGADGSMGGDDSGSGSSMGGAGNGSGASSSGGSGAGASDVPGDTDGDGLPDDISFTYDPTQDQDAETCADVSISSEEVFLDMFLILDSSGSMISASSIWSELT